MKNKKPKIQIKNKECFVNPEQRGWLKGNIVIPPPFKVKGKWYEWIPWDEI